MLQRSFESDVAGSKEPMSNSTIICWALVMCFAAARCALCQTTVNAITANIRTAHTSLELQAQEENPRLVALGSAGQLTWMNSAAESLIGSVEAGGRSIPLKWKFNRAASRIADRDVAFVYESTSPKLRLVWEWKARVSTGPIEHTVHIENLGASELWIPLQDSFQFQWQVAPNAALEQFFIEKGAGKPSQEGTHRSLLTIGYRWQGTSSTYAHPASGQPREIIPWFAVESTEGSRNGWYVGIEFSGRTRLSLERGSNSLRGAVGLNPDPGPFRTRLKAHESFDTPTVFVGAFNGGLDELGNVLRPWVRRALTSSRTWQNRNYPLLTNNTWGSGMQVERSAGAAYDP